MDEEKPEHKSVQSAILAVMAEVGYVQKSGKVDFTNKKTGFKTNYSYAGEAALIAALRPAMVKHGIIVHCDSVEVLSNQGGIITALSTYAFNHPASNTEMKVSAIGQGADSQDKAAYKAMTGAFKYALRQTFIIETGDDPDAESSEEIEAKKREKEAAEAERKLQERKAKSEAKAKEITDAYNATKTIAELQAVKDRECAAINWIKENFPDVDMDLHREYEKTLARVSDNA